MKYILFFFVLFFSIPFLLAKEITVEQSQKMAVNFFSETMQTRGGTLQLQLVWDGESIATRSRAVPAF